MVIKPPQDGMPHTPSGDSTPHADEQFSRPFQPLIFPDSEGDRFGERRFPPGEGVGTGTASFSPGEASMINSSAAVQVRAETIPFTALPSREVNPS
jgi:hypothetical protein